MTEQKLLTVREVSLLLGVSERQVIELAEGGVIPAYKVGGVYLRFKPEQVQEYRRLQHASPVASATASLPAWKEKLNDFFYFYDFYLLAIVFIALILILIFRGH